MTAVCTVLSGMDPHTIRVTWIGMVHMLDFGWSGVLGRTVVVASMVGLVSRFDEKSF
jgi:hypothetical protein